MAMFSFSRFVPEEERDLVKNIGSFYKDLAIRRLEETYERGEFNYEFYKYKIANIDNLSVRSLFNWSKTPEGRKFWSQVKYGQDIPQIPQSSKKSIKIKFKLS